MGLLWPFSIALTGTSLTTGRLSGDWRAQLNHDLREQPEAKGLEIKVYDLGHGGWTSADVLNNIQTLVGLQPTHALIDTGSINDCFDGGSGPAISRGTHGTNTIASISALKAGVPGIDITLQTMSPVSTVIASGRPTLADYYADDLAIAAAQSVRSIDNYAGWPKPLDPTLTNGAAAMVLPVTAGYTPMAFGTTWNPADAAASVGVGGTNSCGAYSASAGHGCIRASTAFAAGKTHVEFAAVVSNTPYPVLGLCTAAHGLTADLGFTATSFGLYQNASNASVFNNSGSVAAIGFPYINGDTMGLEVDTVAKLLYLLRGASRSAGIDYSTLGAAAIYPAVCFAAPGGAVNANFSTGGDGLHPVWTGAVDTYLYPNVLAWARARMAEIWP